MSFRYYGLSHHDFNRCRDDVIQQNKVMCRKLGFAAMLLQICLFFVALQSEFLHQGMMVYAVSGMCYAAIVIAAHRHHFLSILPYAFLFVALTEGSLASLAFSDSVSVILPAMLVSLPLLIIDNLWTISIVTVCCCLVHLLLAFNTKLPILAFFDLVHLVAFGFLGLCAHYWISSLRLHYFLKDMQKNELLQQLHEAHERLQHALEYDPLTCLLTRDTISKRVECMIQQNIPFFIGLLDIDDFKHINDTFGHQIGDVALRTVGSVLTASLRKEDMAARFGGDEFLFVIHGCTSIETAQAVTNRIVAHLAEQKQLPTLVTLSIGLSAFPVSGKVFEDLYRKADHALYQGKHAGKNQIVFSPELR